MTLCEKDEVVLMKCIFTMKSLKFGIKIVFNTSCFHYSAMNLADICCLYRQNDIGVVNRIVSEV